MRAAKSITLAILAFAACGDDAPSAEMKASCTILCECDFNTVTEVETCTNDCLKIRAFTDDCNACYAMHDGKCTTITDCDNVCQ